MKLKKSDILLPLGAFLLFIGFWQLSTSFFAIPKYVLPSPHDIFIAYQKSGSELRNNFGVTLLESFLGLFLGSSIGFTIGVSMAESHIFQKITLPFLIASNAIPVIAIAPIIIIWFGSSLLAKVMVAAFISFFPVVLNTYKGLSEYPNYYKELFDIYAGSKWQFLIKYKLRNSLHFIITGLKLNATLSVIGAIVGEFVASDRGIGFGILQANYNFDSAKLWCYIFLACLIGVSYYLIIYLAEKIFFNTFKTKQTS